VSRGIVDTILDEIEKAIKAEFYYLAVALALTLPDICAAMESSTGNTSGAQYKAWYDEWLAEKYPEMTGTDLYSLRCGVIHQGRFGHAKMQYSRVIFTMPSAGFVLHRNIFNDALNLDAPRFCRDVVEAVRRWYSAKQNDPIVSRNLPRLLQFRANGLEPYFIDIPVIA
jgi:hypothetical protein